MKADDVTERRAPHAATPERAEATGYPELNSLLADLTAEAKAVLGSNFVGAYLTGSFALGDADEFSDVDFIILTHTDVGHPQLAALQDMHKRLHARGSGWAQHLEGSYAPAERMRCVEDPPSAFWFLDNCASTLERDPHCNTALMRWVLREHGVVLAGPLPEELIDPISPQELQREAGARVREYAEWAPEPTNIGAMSKWKQTYLVVTFCRLLYTLESGRISSKRDACEWATLVLDREWADLIDQAQKDRPGPWERVHQLAEPEIAARTLAFAIFAVSRANDSDTNEHGMQL